ncbi:folate-binding protein [Paralcaligenes sp. KSB-10]|uniref:CAF17-like 4Fe-4S cluster assembly/insertion protein YgfZ n=1 Tax=Paralcaligenes sp. KSB-10 TaxID=2901142 RepID=UPI001E3AE4C6|nr:folate-binding protein [Paralcaligenes sp. KSB-10]UHL64868.1 folate-binding protein [Paralcaligenes sp. KSB-10]
MKDSLLFATALDDLALIEIAGADALSFLHSQLTQDVANLPENTARLAGYCTPKGRLLGTLVLWHAGTAESPIVHALVKADIADALIKRLSMYVLRAKAKLRRTTLRACGIAISRGVAAVSSNTDEAAASRPQAFASDLDSLPAHPAAWSVVHAATGAWIAAPCADSGIDRWWYVAHDTSSGLPAAGAATQQAADGSAMGLEESAQGPGNAFWQAGDIAAGLPWVVAATQDVFIPQTLNLDLIDGVSFSKGCYPGQEVVARSHYRGTVKRRMAYGLASTPSTTAASGLPGLDIYDSLHPDNPCGRVINAAGDDNAAANGKMHLLLEIQLSDLGSAAFRLGQADGPAIELQALPYEIKAGD